ncbi:MAG: precorrin-6y C5,15-methyltransferase (decarboxylating) subunit CbiE [Pirellulales bacterium]
MNRESTVHILGIGDDGLDGIPTSTRRLIEQADLLIGDQRTLSLLPEGGQQRMVIGTNLDEAVERIAVSTEGEIAVLAYGDPLFYGLARYLCDRLGKERFRVQPHVSSMQLAFSRVMETWEDAYLSNLAHHSLDQVVERIRVADKVGLFTTDDWTPAHVARALLSCGVDYFSSYVCENLGSPDERVTQGTLAEIAHQEFSPLNVMILIREAEVPDRPGEASMLRLFGNPEEAFLQSKPKRGLLTPAEVRAMGLAELSLRPDSIVWDVGAGCGSVSIEAARIASAGTTYAIEKDAEDHQLIRENMERFGVLNVVPVLGRAPEAWADLPDPDAVFVEGSGREVSRIVDLAYDRLRDGGRLVANVGSIENLSDVHRTMSRRSGFVKTWMVNLARGTYQLERLRFDALNPTFLLSMTKKPAQD